MPIGFSDHSLVTDLLGQLRSLDEWRQELAANADAESPGIEAVERHRDWLQHQLDLLLDTSVQVPALRRHAG
jgi:hypothetical protein